MKSMTRPKDRKSRKSSQLISPLTPFKLALLNLIRQRSSTIIALVSMAIAVSCAGMLLKLYTLNHNRFSQIAQGGDAVVGAKSGGIEILLSSLNLEGDYPDFLPFNLFTSLRNQQSVQFEDGVKTRPSYLASVIPLVYFGLFKEYRLIGTDESFLARPRARDSLQIAEGRWAAELNEVVLGQAVARLERLSIGDRVSFQPWTSNKPFSRMASPASSFDLQVVGILSPSHSSWDKAFYANLDLARSVLAKAELGSSSIWNADVLHYYLIYLHSGEVGRDDFTDLINKRTVGQVIWVDKEREKLAEFSGTGMNIVLLVTLLILLLGGLSITAVMITKFESMQVQFAILRAIGYKRRQIASWALWEGCLLGVVSALFGGILDAAAFPLLRSFLGKALPDSFVVPAPFYQSIYVWVFAIFAAMIAVFIPLIRTYRQDIHLALSKS